MPDLMTLTGLAQREIERLFAGLANQYPLYTVQNCGWLQPEIIRDEQVRKYWELLRSNVNPNMPEEQAGLAASEAAVLSGIHASLWEWSQGMFYGATPQAFAQEIARRAYIAGITAKIGPLFKAVEASNDQEMRHIVEEMSGEARNGHKSMRSAADVAAQFEQVVTFGIRAIYTGTKLDQAIGGLERQTEVVIASRPSMGKTAIVWQIARNVAASGKRVAFFSLEMSAASLWARAACPEAGVTWRDVLAGKVTGEDKSRLLQKSRELAERYADKLHIEDAPQTTETIWQSVAMAQADLVVVDHLRLLKDKYSDSEVKRLGYCSQQLREIAKAFNCAVLLVSQLNRQVEIRVDKRPSLADLRESGEIEENADLVLMLYSEHYYNPPVLPTDIHPTEIWVRKFRDGARNIKIVMDFDVRKEWFT